MKIYQKLCFNILMKPAKNQKKIPSNFFFMAPVTPQTFQCLLVPDPKKCLKLYRGVGVGGCLGRPRYPYSVPDVGSDPRTDRPADRRHDRRLKSSGDGSGGRFCCLFWIFSAFLDERWGVAEDACADMDSSRLWVAVRSEGKLNTEMSPWSSFPPVHRSDGRASMESTDPPRLPRRLNKMTVSPMGIGQIFWLVFRACAALAWIRPSSLSSTKYFGRAVGTIEVFGSTERSAYEW